MLYKDIISSIILKDKTLDLNLKNALIKYIENSNKYIHFVLEPTQEELNSWKTGLTSTKINLHNFTGTANKLVKLHDDTFVIFRTNLPALHYTKEGTLISQFPFEYGIVSDINTAYQNVIDVKELSYLDNSVSPAKLTTLVAIVMSGTHLVRVYKYADNLWSYFTSFGDATTSGYSGTLLDTPLSCALQTKIDSSNNLKLEFLISNSGNSPISTSSFIKYFKTNLNGVIEGSPTIISYPGINNIGNPGSLMSNETKNINYMKLTNNKLMVISNTENEFGLLELKDDLTLKTIYMKKNFVQILQNNDILDIPNCFQETDQGYVIADDLGHISLLPNNFSTVEKSIGTTKATNSSAEIPFYFPSILDIRIINNDAFILISTGLYKVNLLDWQKKELVFNIDPIGIDYKIEYISGFTDFATIKMSIDSINYYLSDFFIGNNQVVKAEQTLYIKIICDEDKFLLAPKLKSGIIILNPCI